MGRGKRQGQASRAPGSPAARQGDLDVTVDSGSTAEALRFALERHGEQAYGEHPYEHHLQAVLAVVRRYGLSTPSMEAAALLHDVVEDTATTVDELRAVFGEETAQLVWAVSSEPGKNRKERNALTYLKIKATPGATALKLSDRIANVEQSLQDGGRLLAMYRKEHPGFKEALYVRGEHEEMWAHLDGLLAGQ